MTYIIVKRNIHSSFSLENDFNCCLNPRFIIDEGYFVCINCGAVHSRIVDGNPQFAFTKEEKEKRKINERVYSPIGPRTIIKSNKDAKGNYISPRFISKFKRLAKINQNLITARERNLWNALQTFYRFKSLFNIPDYVAEDVLKIYISATKKKLAMGRGIEALISAALYCAFRINKIPIFMEEIIKNANLTKRQFLNCFKEIKFQVLPELGFKLIPLTPINYIDKLNDKLHLSMKCRNMAVNLIEESIREGNTFSGRDPKGIAAAALYLSSKICDDFKTQREICNVSNITEATLRARLKEIEEKNSKLLLKK